jgi:hypothetical protein
MDTLNRIISQSLKRKSVISELRKKYGGKWVYRNIIVIFLFVNFL